MFELLEINNRKKIRDKFLDNIDNATRLIHYDNHIRGYLVCFLHILLVSIPFFFIIFSNNLKIVSISQLILILILIQHFYFDGCWMIRLERKIWNTKDWYGLWTYLFKSIEYFGIKLNRNSRDNIFFIVYSFILGIGFYRIFKLLK